jgi:RNA polymerase sigma-70 factor (ECF subfamily)
VGEEIRTRLRNFAHRLTGDPHLAEDIAQETMVRILEPGTPRDVPYFFAVALNLVRTEARLAARRRQTSDAVEHVADPRPTDPLGRLVAEEEKMRLWSSLGRLPERERLAFLLRFSEGLSCAEVSRTLGMTPNAVSCLLHRGKERLRTLLSARSLKT